MKIIGIKMKPNCSNSYSLTEISELFIESGTTSAFYPKEEVYDYLKQHKHSIYVNIAPFPYAEAVLSKNGEKYVRSEANNFFIDNILELPRYQ